MEDKTKRLIVMSILAYGIGTFLFAIGILTRTFIGTVLFYIIAIALIVCGILALFNNWKLFENYLEDENAKELSEILLDECNIYARSEDYTILVCNKESLAIKLNRVQNQEIISNFIKDVTKTKKTFVYVLDRIRKVNISNKFYNLDRINKLPSKDEIANVKIEKENLINE